MTVFVNITIRVETCEFTCINRKKRKKSEGESVEDKCEVEVREEEEEDLKQVENVYMKINKSYI